MGDQNHEDDHDQLCNIRLGLGLGFGDEYVPKKMNNNNLKLFSHGDDLSFKLIPKEELGINMKRHLAVHDHQQTFQDYYSSSSHNNDAITTTVSERERKKLRLSKEQSTLLEESFKLHTTLNPAQKQALAHQLNLKTRQVEVWFQNRRARTKLKQTEVDCEFLKKCCERLNEENRRLKKELHELKSISKLGASPLYIQLPKAATLTICPSCDKITRTPAAVDTNSPPQ